MAAQDSPNNPPEPSRYYNVKVSVMPEGAGYASGGGSFIQGRSTWIITSAIYPYKFEYWTLNGEKYSEDKYIYYTVEAADVELVAHYKLNPNNPSEPESKITRRLYLECYPANSASFNLSSGEQQLVNQDVFLCAYGNTGFQFTGWYEDQELISDEVGFFYKMQDRNTTLTARFKLNPASPDDPSNFYSTSCIINVVANDDSRGTVGISGLVDGRAVYGTNITITATPNGNYKFLGWSDGRNIVSTDVSYTFMATEEKTFTAMFMYEGYWLKYMLNEEQYASFILEPGETITPLDNPEKSGYEFSGWSDLPATMPSQDVTASGYFYLVGDVNNDDKTDLTDLSALVEILSKNTTTDIRTLKVADMNKDGVLNTSDITGLVRLLENNKQQTDDRQ